MLELDVRELLTGSVIFVETLNTLYRLEKVASKSGLTVEIKVLGARDGQPQYLLDGFQTEFAGMSDGQALTALDGVLRVGERRLNLGFAFEAHPSTGRSHRLTSCVLRISDVSIPALDGINLNLGDFDAVRDDRQGDLRPRDIDEQPDGKIRPS